MSRIPRLPVLGCVLAAALALAGCADAEPSSKPLFSDTPSATARVDEEAAALAAFKAFFAEEVAIAAAGEVPSGAFSETVDGTYREDTIARLNGQIDQGVLRRGAPTFKDERVTVTGDTALVVTCINQDDWVFVSGDGEEVASDDGWTQLGRTLSKTDGAWAVTGASLESTKDTCP